MDDTADHRAIRELVHRQFASMTWDESSSGPDLTAFRSDFLPSAVLYPSARPIAVQSVDRFCARMNALSRSTLRSFKERVIGMTIQVFGNVAVAAVACENTENCSEVNRNVEMMLVVKDGGRWRIAAQAWDRETKDT
ncbi:MAG TPA: hypothetical protein VFV47_01540, partial [Hyphomicrobiaceae bacterium]|nr:hypothetical protein [Hyphomicrobiaceae bacterium]